jgi:hypothetical protein
MAIRGLERSRRMWIRTSCLTRRRISRCQKWRFRSSVTTVILALSPAISVLGDHFFFHISFYAYYRTAPLRSVSSVTFILRILPYCSAPIRLLRHIAFGEACTNRPTPNSPTTKASAETKIQCFNPHLEGGGRKIYPPKISDPVSTVQIISTSEH